MIAHASGQCFEDFLDERIFKPLGMKDTAFFAPEAEIGRLEPPGEFPTPIVDFVLKRITMRGSIVGTRRDLDEAIAFAAEGKVKAEITKASLGDINGIFAKLKAGKIEGRMVLTF